MAMFMNGYHAPYKPEYVRQVIGKVRIGRNGALINLPIKELAYPPMDLNFDFDYQEPSFQVQANFLLIHALDVYSTYKGLKYDCISEANPLLEERPSLGKLVLFKVGIISLLEAMYGEYPQEWEAFQVVSTAATGFVVQSNFEVTRVARTNPRCNKR